MGHESMENRQQSYEQQILDRLNVLGSETLAKIADGDSEAIMDNIPTSGADMSNEELNQLEEAFRKKAQQMLDERK